MPDTVQCVHLMLELYTPRKKPRVGHLWSNKIYVNYLHDRLLWLPVYYMHNISITESDWGNCCLQSLILNQYYINTCCYGNALMALLKNWIQNIHWHCISHCVVYPDSYHRLSKLNYCAWPGHNDCLGKKAVEFKTASILSSYSSYTS